MRRAKMCPPPPQFFLTGTPMTSLLILKTIFLHMRVSKAWNLLHITYKVKMKNYRHVLGTFKSNKTFGSS